VYNGARVQGVAVLVWPQTRGVGSLHSAPPQTLASEEEQKRSEIDPRRQFPLALRVLPFFVEAAKELAGRVMQQPPCGVGEKRFPGRILGCCHDGGEASGSKNENGLEAAGPPGWLAAGMAVVPGPGGLPWRLGLPGVESMAVNTLRRLAAIFSSLCPTWRVKVQGPCRGQTA
jgi:hypothetical protein